MMSPLNYDMQVGALAVLEYVSDLLTVSPRESFSREDLLVLLASVKNDPALFDEETIDAFDALEARVEYGDGV